MSHDQKGFDRLNLPSKGLWIAKKFSATFGRKLGCSSNHSVPYRMNSPIQSDWMYALVSTEIRISP